MEAPRRTESQKPLAPNQRVSSACGEFVPGPSKRRRRQRLFGHIVKAVGERRYLVHFDDGQERECPSNVLKVESASTSIPPDMPLPIREVIQNVSVVEDAAGNPDLLDSEDAEDMPDVRPEEEEAEAAEEEQHAMESEAEANKANGNEALGFNEEDQGVQNNNAASGAVVHDPDGRMQGQLPTEASATVKDYHSIKKAAKEKIAALAGSEVTVTSRKNGSLTWKVVESHSPPGVEVITKSSMSYGLKDFQMGNYKKSEVLAKIFLDLMFLDWKDMVNKMNDAVAASKTKCKKFSNEEFLVGLGIIIGAAEFSQKGVDLFSVKNIDDDDEDDLQQWPSICPSPQFQQYMAFSRFKDFRRFLPLIFADESKKESDPWWQFSGAVEEFNLIRSTKLICSPWITIDETMCAWEPRSKDHATFTLLYNSKIWAY